MSITSDQATEKTVAQGQTLDIDISLSSDNDDKHNASLYRIAFSSPGLMLYSYHWAEPYPNGTIDNFSTPAYDQLPAILDESTVSGWGYPENTTDIELSNLPEGSFSSGLLTTLTVVIPENWDDSIETITVEVIPDTFSYGFMTIPTVASNIFTIHIDPSLQFIKGDINLDTKVNLLDLSIIANQWLNNNCIFQKRCDGSDLDFNGIIDIEDLQSFTYSWLYNNVTIPGLIAHWAFDETEGVLAEDLSGNSNDGTLMNGPQWANGTIRFDGIDDYVEVSDSSTVNITDEISISVWIYMEEYSTDWPKLIVKPYDTDLIDPWELYAIDLGEEGQYPRFIITDGIPASNAVYTFNNSVSLSLNQWHHIVGTYNGEVVMLYVNNQLIAQNHAYFNIGTNDLPLSIGGRLGINGFNGKMDDVRLYNRALDASEIQILYQNP